MPPGGHVLYSGHARPPNKEAGAPKQEDMQRKTDPTPFYRRIVTDAWKISWHHKHLWVFGFFATLIGFGGVTEVFFNAYERTANALPMAAAQGSIMGLIPGLTTIKAIISYSSYPALSLLIFFVVLSLLFAVFAWMTVVSVGGLLTGIRKISRGGEPTFGDDIKAGSERFWRLLGVNALAKIVILLALLMTGANLFVLMRERTMVSGLFYVGSFVVFTAVSFVASLASVYGSLNVMAKDEPVEKSVNGALKLIGEHWLVSLEMAVILFVASLAVGLLVALGTLVGSVPLIFMIVVASVLKARAAIYAIMALTAVLLLIMVVCLGSFLTTFQASAWTLLWSELSERRPMSKLHRLLHGLKR